jgi:TPR repeat protein
MNFGPSLRERAQSGDADAQFAWGAQLTASARWQDKQEAAQWFFKAADQGHIEAQNELGVLFAFGIGVAQNDELAYECFLRAALQGMPAAQYNVGVLCLEGKIPTLTLETATAWFSRAAEQGHVPAMNNLAIMYAKGLGVECNLETAARWFWRAANHGHVNAARHLEELIQNWRHIDDIGVVTSGRQLVAQQRVAMCN